MQDIIFEVTDALAQALEERRVDVAKVCRSALRNELASQMNATVSVGTPRDAGSINVRSF